jgi:hypothetical protein
MENNLAILTLTEEELQELLHGLYSIDDGAAEACTYRLIDKIEKILDKRTWIQHDSSSTS